MNKSNLSYKDMLQAKDTMDMLAMNWQEGSVAFGALKSFLIGVTEFVETNTTDAEWEMLDKIGDAVSSGTKTVLVKVRGNWYQALAVVKQRRTVCLKQRVVEAADNPFADNIFVFEIQKLVIS